jgi:tripartite-type tricarboxylate transporter receptor subunit TctC
MTRLRRRTLLAAPAALLARPAAAQDRPLRLLVGFPPGGTLDIIARLVAEPLQREAAGRAVVVENRAGGGGRIAAEALARDAVTDGSVAMLAPNVVTGFFPHIYARLPFDPLADLAPVTMLCTFKFGLAVRADHPARDLAGFIAWAKAQPGGGNFGSLSAGTPSHFLGALLNRESGTRLQHVPYRGSPPLVTALLAGEVDTGFDNTASLIPQLRDGRLRILAVTGAARSPLLPQIPTFAEAGLALGEVERAEFWYGLYAPGRTTPAATATLARQAAGALRDATVAQRLAALDLEVKTMPPADFAAIVKADSDRWGPVIRATGFTINE